MLLLLYINMYIIGAYATLFLSMSVLLLLLYVWLQIALHATRLRSERQLEIFFNGIREAGVNVDPVTLGQIPEVVSGTIVVMDGVLC